MMFVVSFLSACTLGPPPADRAPGGDVPDVKGHTGGATEPEPEPTEPDCVPSALVSINEVQPSNAEVLVDEDGDSVDWLELYNPGRAAVDLHGFSLADDKEPGDWTLPALVLEPAGFLLVYASGKDRRQFVESWETRIDAGHVWRWLDVDGPQPPDWYQSDFDDSTWRTGPSGFGKGDEDDATTAWANTIYVRTDLELSASDLSELGGLILHVDYDDGFVAYLNGVEVARAGLGPAGAPIAWDTSADQDHEAQLYQLGKPDRFDLWPHAGLLREGANVLALEVHNANATSSDLTLVPFVSLGSTTARSTPASPLLDLPLARPHTDFSLSSDGEAVRLFDPAGCEVDELEPDDTAWGDYSYGRTPDGSDDRGWFAEPTPGASNVTESRPGFAETPGFDPAPGFYPDGVTVTVLSASDAEVHVAWDGWEPTAFDPSVTGPIEVPEDREARVLRARAWQEGLWPSRIATSTWFLREPGTLPVVSVVTDPPNLWDDETGIYTSGLDYDPVWPHPGANYWEDWERPAHLALWEPDRSLGFALDGGVSIHGGRSRAHEQKNLLVNARSTYGDTSIEHEVFPGLGVTSFDSLLLRAAGNDWLGCFSKACSQSAELRDALIHQIAREELDVMAYRPAEGYLNGEYWGIYDLREKLGADYTRSHFGVEDIDLLEVHSSPVEGDTAHYEATLEYLRTHDLADPANYAHVQTLIDVDELSSYLLHEVFFDNTDWPGNNIKYWRPRTPDGRWRWMLYDADFGLGNWRGPPETDTLAHALDPAHEGWPNPPWSTELFRLMMTSPQFFEDFVNRYADELNTDLRPEATRAELHGLAAGIEAEIPRHAERWGYWTDGLIERRMRDGFHLWTDEIAWIDQWLGERPAFARQHVVANFGLAGTWDLRLLADPPGSGSVALTTVVVEPPFTGVYFRGVPVTVTALPAPGYTFAGWSDPSLPSTPTVTLPADGLAGPLTARFR